jgi:hypothetical protein
MWKAEICCLGKRIDVSDGTIWNIATVEGITRMIHVDRRHLAKADASRATRR